MTGGSVIILRSLILVKDMRILPDHVLGVVYYRGTEVTLIIVRESSVVSRVLYALSEKSTPPWTQKPDNRVSCVSQESR